MVCVVVAAYSTVVPAVMLMVEKVGKVVAEAASPNLYVPEVRFNVPVAVN